MHIFILTRLLRKTTELVALSNYLRWFDIFGLATNPSARACLNVALGLQPSVSMFI
jgi:hypothetical protein